MKKIQGFIKTSSDIVISNTPSLTHTSSPARPLTFVPLPYPSHSGPHAKPPPHPKVLKRYQKVWKVTIISRDIYRRILFYIGGTTYGPGVESDIVYISRTMKTLHPYFVFSKVTSLKSFRRKIHLNIHNLLYHRLIAYFFNLCERYKLGVVMFLLCLTNLLNKQSLFKFPGVKPWSSVVPYTYSQHPGLSASVFDWRMNSNFSWK